MLRFFAVFVATFALLAGLDYLFPTKPPKPVPIHTYNLFPSGPTGPKMATKGTKIETEGFCVKIYLNGRVDTVLCPGGLIVTEAEEADIKTDLPEVEG